MHIQYNWAQFFFSSAMQSWQAKTCHFVCQNKSKVKYKNESNWGIRLGFGPNNQTKCENVDLEPENLCLFIQFFFWPEGQCRPERVQQEMQKKRKTCSFLANRLIRSNNFRGCAYYNSLVSRLFSFPAFIRMKALWVMNEAVCFPAAVLHYQAIVCVIRARSHP